MKLEIISPERRLFSGEVEKVSLPGTKGRFTILQSHAAIISSLSEGSLVYSQNEVEHELNITGGFIEMKNNEIVVCVE
ncbi:hypothetical protein AwDysgo_12660 [Bacteroidales bacterium]|nr:hypothetical protein AwDysgo_12660 [Bacteroidales bacterium]